MIRRLLLLLAIPFLLSAGENQYTESKYKTVAGLTVDTTGGVVIPNGQKVGLVRFVGTGNESPDVFVILAFCWGGASQKIFASTSGNLFFEVDPKDTINQVTGTSDASCSKITIVIDNDSASTSNVVGGRFEAVNI